MTTTLLLTGGTGTLGRHVVPLLHESDVDLRVLSRRPHEANATVRYTVGDLATGAGIAEAVAGVDTVLHCAGSQRGDDVKMRHLVDAAADAGVRHVVYISVVGADRIEVVGRLDRKVFGYYAAKLAGERILEQSGLPWTTLRATQFHDLMLMLARAVTRLPVAPVDAGIRFQPVDTAEVAGRLVELALAGPAALVPDLAGPRTYGMDEIVRTYLAAAHRRRPLVGIRVPGRAAASLRSGANLAPDRAVGRRTWEDFLGSRVSRRA